MFKKNVHISQILDGLSSKIAYLIILPFQKEAVCIVFLFLLGLISIYSVYTSKFYLSLLYQCLEYFFEVYVLAYIINIIPTSLKRFFKFSVCAFLYTITIVDLFCYIRLGTTITPNITQLLNETNLSETQGFFESYIDIKLLISPIGIVVLIAILHLVTSVYFSYKINKIFTNAVKFLLCKIILSIVLAWGCSLFIDNKRNLWTFYHIQAEDGFSEFYTFDYTRQKINYLPVYRLFTSLYTNSISNRQVDNYISNFHSIHINSCDFLSPNIILIIGESYNKYHSGLYGYSMPTTLFQDSLYHNGQLFVYMDAVTPHNLTSEVFKNILSLNDYSHKEKWSSKPLFPQLFKEAGYHVSFLSNQYIESDMTDFSAGAFINDHDISKCIFNTRNKQLYKFDEDLIISYDSLRIQKNKYNLSIFHLVGQHISYKERYPKTYRELHTNLYHRGDLKTEEREILSEYDNATRYNDDVLRMIIEKFKETNTIILYLSDHGEECYDEIHTFGRTHNTQITKDIAKNEFEIPFWIWCSEEYKSKHTALVEAISQSTEKPFYSSDLGFLMLRIAGLSCDYYDKKRDILDDKYDSVRKRLLRGSIYYEDLFTRQHQDPSNVEQNQHLER